MDEINRSALFPENYIDVLDKEYYDWLIAQWEKQQADPGAEFDPE